MTTLSVADIALRAEVKARILAIIPTVREGTRLKEYSKEARKATPIMEFTGASRIFDFGELRDIEHYCLGYTDRGLLKEIPITFVYKRSARWQNAAADDLERIRHDLLVTSGSHGVAGVANRHIPPEIPTELVPNEEDPWDYYTVVLRVWFQIDD